MHKLGFTIDYTTQQNPLFDQPLLRGQRSANQRGQFSRIFDAQFV